MEPQKDSYKALVSFLLQFARCSSQGFELRVSDVFQNEQA